MWPGILVGGARVAAGRFPVLGPRLAARFSPRRTPKTGLALQRSLHATAARALPLIPIVVEQTVHRPRELDPAWESGVSGPRHCRPLTPTATFLPQGRGERAYDIYSRLLRERIVCVMGPVSALPGLSSAPAQTPCAPPPPRTPLTS